MEWACAVGCNKLDEVGLHKDEEGSNIEGRSGLVQRHEVGFNKEREKERREREKKSLMKWASAVGFNKEMYSKL